MRKLEILEVRNLLAFNVAELEFARVAPVLTDAAETEEFWYDAAQVNHEWTSGSNDVIVAVFDSGVDYTHPEIARQIWINRREVPTAFLDAVFLDDPNDGDGIADNNLRDIDQDGLFTFWDLNEDTYLFESPTAQNSVAELNNGDVPNIVRDGFVNFGTVLSANPTVTVVAASSEWQIQDQGLTFTVSSLETSSNERLNIFGPFNLIGQGCTTEVGS